MAKEWHNWGRYILLAIVIVFGSGGWVMKVKSNTDAITAAEKHIDKTDEKVEELEDDVHALELNNKDIANIAQQGTDYMATISKTLEEMQKEMAESGKVQAVNSSKLKTLIKDGN